MLTADERARVRAMVRELAPVRPGFFLPDVLRDHHRDLDRLHWRMLMVARGYTWRLVGRR